MSRFLPRRRPRRQVDLVVWLDPGPRGSAGAFVPALRHAVQLVVVPRTGSRQADLAVLLDPDPVELVRIRRLLPAAALVALPAAAPSPALAVAARRAGATLLPAGTSPTQLLQEIRAYAPARPTAATPAPRVPASGNAGRERLAGVA